MRGLQPIPLAATMAAVVLSAIAVWQILESGDSIGGIGPYEPRTPAEGTVAVTVEEGASPEQIGEALKEAGVIESATQFQVLVAFMGYDRLLQAGEYEFRPDTPALEAIYRIRRGEVSVRAVTVIEGWRIEQIADAAAETGVPREEFVAAASDPSRYDFEFLRDLPAGATLEGYLYPARYSIGREESAEDLVRKMLEAFADNVPEGLRESASQFGLTFHEVLTLASIIEREAQAPEERPIMAQVFHSRLDLGMPLEADPTVQYAVSQEPASVAEHGYWKAELTAADLEHPSPYNTYVHAGLPPGPIANPRLDSIVAVLNPAPTNFLYFVARPDGSHVFAETFEEHLQNVEEIRSEEIE